MPLECWKPSAGLRAIVAACRLAGTGFAYVLLLFCFPHVFLAPVTAVVATSGLFACCAPFRVQLDSAAGEVAITLAFWTRHVPARQVERVEEALRFGPEIALSGGISYSFSPFKAASRLSRQLRVRTGFEGMELALTEAAVAARAATDPSDAGQGQAGWLGAVSAACLTCGAGLAGLGVAALVHEQARGWLVYTAALLLRAWYGAVGALFMVVGAGMLLSALRKRRPAHEPRPG